MTAQPTSSVVTIAAKSRSKGRREAADHLQVSTHTGPGAVRVSEASSLGATQSETLQLSYRSWTVCSSSFPIKWCFIQVSRVRIYGNETKL